jgi:homoserine kinase
VPASSANLGPGFDCLALGVDLRIRAFANWDGDRVRLGDFSSPLDWWHECCQPFSRFAGTLERFAKAHPDEPNLIGSAFVRAILAVGPEYHLPRRLEFELASDIPIGQGLGSSAAASVAGAALAGIWRTGELDRERAFAAAVEIEGHADNAAAAAFGGLQAALLFGRETRARTLRIHDSLRIALAVPRESLKLSTDATRRWLPESLKRTDAVSNQRALLTLLYGLETADAGAIQAGFEDRLHVPHRKGMIVGFDDIVRAALDAGAFGATISGAGGSVIAIGQGDMTAVAQAMSDAFARHGMEAQALTPAIDTAGLRLEA